MFVAGQSYFGRFVTPRHPVVAARRQRLPDRARGGHDLRHPDRRHRPLGRRRDGVHRDAGAPSCCRSGVPTGGRHPDDDRRRAPSSACIIGVLVQLLRRATVHRLAGRDVPGPRSVLRASASRRSRSRTPPCSACSRPSSATGGWYITPTGIIALLVIVVAAWVLGYTRFGRTVYAIGGNEQSARLMGLPGRAHQGAGLRDQRRLRR